MGTDYIHELMLGLEIGTGRKEARVGKYVGGKIKV